QRRRRLVRLDLDGGGVRPPGEPPGELREAADLDVERLRDRSVERDDVPRRELQQIARRQGGIERRGDRERNASDVLEQPRAVLFGLIAAGALPALRERRAQRLDDRG